MNRWEKISGRRAPPRVEDESYRAEVRCACGELVVISDHDDWVECECGRWFRIWAKVEVHAAEWIGVRGSE